jgi:HD-GYP domain-containing protein (c-di-GMP phosphodiesterase class II)
MTTRGRSLKKITVEQLRLGMFVAEFCGSWMDHPFWTTKFKLEDPSDLQTIRESAITELWIDTARGLDVDRGDDAPAQVETAEQAEARVERELQEAVNAAHPAEARVALEAEVARAAAICGKARRAVTAMFSEARMGGAIDTGQLEPLVEEISGSVMRNPGALISLARLKSQDDYTYMHSVAVCALMVSLARKLGLDEAATREAGLAGLVHDVGKAAVSLDILNKPGKLTDAEFAHMKSHPVAGHAMLAEGGTAGDIALDVCLHHHEKMDGTGYPHKLNDANISLFARMGAVCDVYDAITSDRPYKAGWDPATAIRRMNEWSKGHFDPRVFQAFVKTVGIYPVGSLVRLESGLLAVVSEVDPTRLLTPRVKTVYCTRRRQRTHARELDLAGPGTQDRITGWEDPSQWGFPDLNELWAGEAAVAQQRRGAA